MPVATCLALHDMVTLGRCSLTIAIPAISAMGSKVCPLPTALLSSDTGGYGPVYFHEQSVELNGILAKLDALDARFDAVYSGYLGTPSQAAFVEQAMARFGRLHIVDPVMGDMGRLYSNIGEEMVAAMQRLCRRAQVITPNLTEAAFLTGTPMPAGPMTGKKASELLHSLQGFGCRDVIITSACLEGIDGLCTLWLGNSGKPMALHGPLLQVHYPGTGDLFASVLTGALLKGEAIRAAILDAAAFTLCAIAYTVQAQTPQREGVLLEPLLGELAAGQYDRTPLQWIEL